MNGVFYYFERGEQKLEYAGYTNYKIKRCRRKSEVLFKTFKTVEPSGGSGKGLKVKLTIYKNDAWEAEIKEKGTGYRNGDVVTLPIPGPDAKVKVTVNDENVFKLNPYDMLMDYRQYDTESASNDSNPEHEISYVNEIRKPNGVVPQYNNLSTLGLMISSSVDITNISQISTYIKRGIVGRAWTETEATTPSTTCQKLF